MASEAYVNVVKSKMKDQSCFPSTTGVGIGRRIPLSLVLFHKYDQDEDGVLSLTEFKAFCDDKGYFMSGAEFIATIAKIDADGSGDISYDEFMVFWADEDRHMHMQLNDSQQQQVGVLFECFEQFDENHTGLLDFQEYKNLILLLAQKGLPVQGDAKISFQQADVSGDGKVTFPEMLRFLIEKFGILTAE